MIGARGGSTLTSLAGEAGSLNNEVRLSPARAAVSGFRPQGQHHLNTRTWRRDSRVTTHGGVEHPNQHARDSLSNMPAECQTVVGANTECAVLAIGRCRDCGRAFCGSHRGRYVERIEGFTQTVWQDLCTDCSAVRGRTPTPAQQRQVDEQRARSAAARSRVALEAELKRLAGELAARGVPRQARQIVVGSRKRMFSRQDAVFEGEPAWPVGPCAFGPSGKPPGWHVDSQSLPRPKKLNYPSAPGGVTAAGEIVPIAALSQTESGEVRREFPAPMWWTDPAWLGGPEQREPEELQRIVDRLQALLK